MQGFIARLPGKKSKENENDEKENWVCFEMERAKFESRCRYLGRVSSYFEALGSGSFAAQANSDLTEALSSLHGPLTAEDAHELLEVFGIAPAMDIALYADPKTRMFSRITDKTRGRLAQACHYLGFTSVEDLAHTDSLALSDDDPLHRIYSNTERALIEGDEAVYHLADNVDLVPFDASGQPGIVIPGPKTQKTAMTWLRDAMGNEALQILATNSRGIAIMGSFSVWAARDAPGGWEPSDVDVFVCTANHHTWLPFYVAVHDHVGGATFQAPAKGICFATSVRIGKVNLVLWPKDAINDRGLLSTASQKFDLLTCAIQTVVGPHGGVACVYDCAPRRPFDELIPNRNKVIPHPQRVQKYLDRDLALKQVGQFDHSDEWLHLFDLAEKIAAERGHASESREFDINRFSPVDQRYGPEYPISSWPTYASIVSNRHRAHAYHHMCSYSLDPRTATCVEGRHLSILASFGNGVELVFCPSTLYWGGAYRGPRKTCTPVAVSLKSPLFESDNGQEFALIHNPPDTLTDVALASPRANIKRDPGPVYLLVRKVPGTAAVIVIEEDEIPEYYKRILCSVMADQ